METVLFKMFSANITGDIGIIFGIHEKQGIIFVK